MSLGQREVKVGAKSRGLNAAILMDYDIVAAEQPLYRFVAQTPFRVGLRHTTLNNRFPRCHFVAYFYT